MFNRKNHTKTSCCLGHHSVLNHSKRVCFPWCSQKSKQGLLRSNDES